MLLVPKNATNEFDADAAVVLVPFDELFQRGRLTFKAFGTPAKHDKKLKLVLTPGGGQLVVPSAKNALIDLVAREAGAVLVPRR